VDLTTNKNNPQKDRRCNLQMFSCSLYVKCLINLSKIYRKVKVIKISTR